MGIVRLIIKEIAHRKLNFLLSLLGVVAAVALFVAFYTAGKGSDRETTRIMRNLGLNLRILPKQTDMDDFWLTGYSKHTMPVEYVEAMASHSGLGYAHLLPMLKERFVWGDRTIVLVGVLPEVSPVDKKKPSMSYTVEVGSVFVGAQVALGGGLKVGSVIELGGKSLRVARCLEAKGGEQDITVYAHLDDVQEIVNKPGQINEIQALNCLCFDEDRNKLAALKRRLAEVLPEAEVVQMRAMADARFAQRRTVRDYLAVIVPVVLVLCAGWVGLLAMINVRDRRQEIGILRALGFDSGRIASLLLGKAVIVGLVGAAIGFAIGTWIALHYGPSMFSVTGDKLAPMYDVLWWSLAISPVFAAMASLLPTMSAVLADPAVTLRED